MSKSNEEEQNTSPESNELTLDIKEDSEIFLEFLSEVLDHLEESESSILSIEDETCDYEVINAIFRSIHSIKGSAGFLGLTDMQRLSHELEALLDKARKGEITITQEIIDISLNAVDVLRKLRDNLAIRVDRELGKITESDIYPKEQPVDIQPLIDTIVSILNKENKPEETAPELQNADCELRKETNRNSERVENSEAEVNPESSDKDFLGGILLDEGTITQDQLDKALNERGKKIGKILVEEGVTTVEEEQNTSPESNELTLDIKEDSEIFLEFLSEVLDHLEDSESNVLSIEDDACDYETINAIFRSIHSIKGSAGFLGLTKMQRLSHELEALLDKVRKDEITISQEILNISLSSIDALRKLRDNLEIRVGRELGNVKDSDSSPKEQPIDIQPLIDTIVSILNKENKPEKAASELQNADCELRKETIQNSERVENTEVEVNPESSEKDCLGEILLDEGTITQDQLDKALNEQGKKIGEILVEEGVTTAEEVENALDEQIPIGQILTEKGEITEPQLAGVLKQQNRKVGEILVDSGATTAGDIDSALQSQQNQRKAKLQSRTVKVDTTKLDNLFDLVGELVITNTLICGEMNSVNDNGTSKNLSQLTKITKDIQDQVMSMRMVTLKQTFQKMSRLVRDVSLRSGKKVKLQISGEETELDKNVIEELADPLVHILRNSIDHGVEPEEDRVSKGKPAEGLVKLSAFHRGGNIVIEIQDDGNGLRKDKILQKAIDRGIVTSPSSLTDNQIYNLIFAPGLSTAAKVTNISGRGVGMDVVKKNIEKLRGNIEVTSEEGEGCTFTIKLPLTLAIIDGIVVNVGDTKYIIPTVSIEESLRPTKEDVSTINNQGEVVNIRGSLLSLVRLHKLYNIDTKKTNPWESIVVVVEGAEGRYGILVDELLGQQQVVIKSLGERFKGIKGISGSAILGDGRVGLILDVSGVREAFVGSN